MEAGEPGHAVILSLGQKQLAAVRAVATDRHGEYLDAAEYVSANRHDVNMPAAGWRALCGPLSERAFNKRGEWSSKHEGAGSALRTIVGNLQALEAHPAFIGRAVVDPTIRRHRMVVGFKHRIGSSRRSPYLDAPGMTLLVLVPTAVDLEVDLGAGPVEVEGVRWVERLPHTGDVDAGMFVDPADHEGWSTAPVGAER